MKWGEKERVAHSERKRTRKSQSCTLREDCFRPSYASPSSCCFTAQEYVLTLACGQTRATLLGLIPKSFKICSHPVYFVLLLIILFWVQGSQIY